MTTAEKDRPTYKPRGKGVPLDTKLRKALARRLVKVLNTDDPPPSSRAIEAATRLLVGGEASSARRGANAPGGPVSDADPLADAIRRRVGPAVSPDLDSIAARLEREADADARRGPAPMRLTGGSEP